MESEKKIPIIVVCGPTASGKTALAVELAVRHNGEVVSADSMQIYKGMRIGTAAPDESETRGIPHHLIGIIEPDMKFSVADYVKYADAAIRDIHARGKLPVIAGGTGLYISALLDNISFSPMESNLELRAELQSIAYEKGNEFLWEMLRECDPILAEKLHPNNLGRVIRGVEVFRLTGTPMSEHQSRSKLTPPDYAPAMIGLTFSDRQLLYKRIDGRVDKMIRDGLLKEAEELLGGLNSKDTSSQAIGYKELAPYFSGEILLEEAVDKIKMETRRYAKRQLTWFRRDNRIHWINVDEYADIRCIADEADKFCVSFDL